MGWISGTAGGAGPIANNKNAIAIGSANSTFAGSVSSGISSIAIGTASTVLAGASASGDFSIAIGNDAIATTTGCISIGSGGTTSAGTGALSNSFNAIAIGSGNGSLTGALATGTAAIAIGGADTAAGASASGLRSIAIGTGATTSQADAIVFGNSAVTAVKVGIGINAPTAKFHVVGVNGTVVAKFDQANSAIGNAPVWLNPSTSAVAGTPIHYNASNQLFGFTSSQRYKTNIRNIDSESEIIYKLNPVLYDPKEGYGQGANIPGFIAEQVYEIDPNLAILNNKKEPENVAYNSLHALAIKEIQKQQKQIEEQDKIISKQSTVIEKLELEISKLHEKFYGLETEISE